MAQLRAGRPTPRAPLLPGFGPLDHHPAAPQTMARLPVRLSAAVPVVPRYRTTPSSSLKPRSIAQLHGRRLAPPAPALPVLTPESLSFRLRSMAEPHEHPSCAPAERRHEGEPSMTSFCRPEIICSTVGVRFPPELPATCPAHPTRARQKKISNTALRPSTATSGLLSLFHHLSASHAESVAVVN